jgi:hypothetical protein
MHHNIKLCCNVLEYRINSNYYLFKTLKVISKDYYFIEFSP